MCRYVDCLSVWNFFDFLNFSHLHICIFTHLHIKILYLPAIMTSKIAMAQFLSLSDYIELLCWNLSVNFLETSLTGM
jgi:hypothetical protein